MSEEMPDSTIPSSPTCNKPGIPNWQEPSEYPDVETTSIQQWRWEFLRRRGDYYLDWLKNYTASLEKVHETHSIDDPCVYEEDGKEILYSPKIHFALKKLRHRVEMPGSIEKYGLEWLPNPTISCPEMVPFTDRPREVFSIGVGEEIRNYSGLDYILFPGEVLIEFDLTLQPVERLFALFTKRYPTTDEEEDVCEGVDRDDISLVDLILYGKNANKYTKVFKCVLPRGPRVIIDPQKKAYVHVIFDRTHQSFWTQWSIAKEKLTALQKELVGDLPQRRFHPDVAQNYLRILDARDLNPDSEMPKATYEEIGRVVLKIKKDLNKARSRAKQAHEQAKALQLDFPH